MNEPLDPHYIDPAVGIPLALAAWTILGVIKWIEARRER